MLLFANIVSLFKYSFLKFKGLSVIFILMVVFLFPQAVNAQKGAKITTIVIDAGHGGKDPGASGKHSREKDIALAVALKLGKYISQNMKDVRVIYTRKTDRFIPLYRRAEIANENHADVFISIHCNSNPSTRPYGAESYVIGLHKTAENLSVAEKENSAILFEGSSSKSKYGNFKLDSPQSYINMSLFQNLYLGQSLLLAHNIEKEMKVRAGRKARGVYQAGFLVLWQTAMPSVLVELGFLSNPKEEAFLKSSKGQIYLASAIYRAFKRFKQNFEKENQIIKTIPSKTKTGLSKGILNKPYYTVQFYLSRNPIKNLTKKFPGIKSISFYKNGNYYKYISGHFSSSHAAYLHQKKLRKSGYKDAFVVALYKGRRISLSSAKKMLIQKK